MITVKPAPRQAAAAAADQPMLSVEDLRVTFTTADGESLKAVDGISFEVRPGETFGVIGESGSGKSTLGRAIVRLLDPTGGRILYEGDDIARLKGRRLRHKRRELQIIFQDPNAALNPRMSILDSVREPLDVVGEGDRASRIARALDLLDRVGISAEQARRYPHELSGGQKQRVNIARSLTLDPKLMVCDEVVAALDVSIRGDVLNLFAEIQRERGLAYVFITHDIGVVSHISDRVAVMYLGRFMELGPVEAVAERPMHPYTRALMSAEPVPLPSHLRQKRRILLEGEIPSPLNPPSGCRFRTRCPHAQATCAERVPDWRPVAPDHFVACHFAEDLAPG
ncbi:ATP-binding cassette domain-containing protein (plasmid) [Tistrella mobilis]|jgi:peptide/nickel transport system ATP-binding protein/oligopeptide transport system ATP-binding protein|uniref:ABC transporter ATP-binding protein n=1 Tax=Tistrella mobilis TaxID=171437 RepID=UPI003557C3D8